jgi:hypothetical protein
MWQLVVEARLHLLQPLAPATPTWACSGVTIKCPKCIFSSHPTGSYDKCCPQAALNYVAGTWTHAHDNSR